MIKIKNTSPLGALDVPLLGGVIKAGATVTVTKDQATRLLRQSIWTPVGKEAIALARKSDVEPRNPDAAVVEGPGVTIGEDGIPILSATTEEGNQPSTTNDGSDPAPTAQGE